MRLRSRCIVAGAALALLVGCVHRAETPDAPQYDLIVTGGEVYDGDGQLLDGVDIAIRDGKISRVEPGLAGSVSSDLVLDAEGLVVAPGFIDPHTHGEDELATGDQVKQSNLPYIYQGVTTVVVGNDGFGFPALRDVAASHPAGTNYAFLSGFGEIRSSVMGAEDRPATADELTKMRSFVRRDMCLGALGFSTSLRYVPQTFADTDEVAELASEAARFGGYYDTHMRDESDKPIGVLVALDEAIEIAQRAQMPLHVSHIKALGPATWGQSADMIARIETAHASGLEVTADQYPWAASGTRISRALVPGWALDGGLEGLRERLKDAELRAQIKAGIIENIARRGGADSLLITAPLHGIEIEVGNTLAQLADLYDLSPEEAALSVLLKGDARLASFNMSADDIAAFAEQDWVMTGSDGDSAHPRKYASFPKAFDDLVRKGGHDIGWFVRRSTGLTAKSIGLTDRGFLREGYAADLVIFDPAKYQANANFSEPELLSSGIEWLLVNGQITIGEGAHNGRLAGQLLRKNAPDGFCE